jgi:hypothetical protein
MLCPDSYEITGEILYNIESSINNTISEAQLKLTKKKEYNLWAEALDAIRFVIHTKKREIVVDDFLEKNALRWCEVINKARIKSEYI